MVILEDLPKTLGIDTENEFKPSYTITQRNTVAELRKLAKKCSDVYLACDKDREGESIAYIAEILKIPLSKKKKNGGLQKLLNLQYKNHLKILFHLIQIYF